MNNELKKAIIEYIFDNLKYMNLVNQTIDHFKAYVYNAEGNYLIGGQGVSDFIKDAIKLIEGEK